MPDMNIYKVIRITEADYGCEETGRSQPMALLELKHLPSGEETHSTATSEENRFQEVSEEWISQNGISEGKTLCYAENGNLLKYVRVVAAVIHEEKNGTERIFATARGYGKYKDWWEFPGGKIEEGETPEEALKREIREELASGISVGRLIHTIEYDYPEFHLSMDCFWCELQSGKLQLLEAEDARWLTKETLRTVNWLPADLELIRILEEQYLTG